MPFMPDSVHTRIHGCIAVTGGIGLALSCDRCMKVADAYFGVPLIDGETVRLPQALHRELQRNKF